ncbi:hypothetical protein DICPUDRAFT_29312 [Dictyostelium purpureum]|uniref:ShKT domain-containing protein n=1 Tax=Dictyostelium purpureum TaxID=5786 RepID=F0ZDF0_DICPU|nr:uncharacterized protein DICPUDRAFT_29312 [Dictyostelium purpureum]EGC38031.1 hypothetical protein DICPUDRAFT_29312 [Dictyostelium purpureum]|eukprot:XP_003285432.1 hypothetical protein DICPUDRAFT_29312 [Dictyostelium purpureum]
MCFKYLVFFFLALLISLSLANQNSGCHTNCNLDFDNCYDSYSQNPSNNLYSCISQWQRCFNNCESNNQY